jgi:hypothetical protein
MNVILRPIQGNGKTQKIAQVAGQDSPIVEKLGLQLVCPIMQI